MHFKKLLFNLNLLVYYLIKNRKSRITAEEYPTRVNIALKHTHKPMHSQMQTHNTTNSKGGWMKFVTCCNIKPQEKKSMAPKYLRLCLGLMKFTIPCLKFPHPRQHHINVPASR